MDQKEMQEGAQQKSMEDMRAGSDGGGQTYGDKEFHKTTLGEDSQKIHSSLKGEAKAREYDAQSGASLNKPTDANLNVNRAQGLSKEDTEKLYKQQHWREQNT